MKSSNHLTLSTSPQHQPMRKPRGFVSITRRHRFLYGRTRRYYTGKERDSETGLYYYGARYLDGKTSRWISGDPAMGEYVPEAPVDDEARKRNGNLPGMGGVFNYVNLHVYHYAGNNPVKYVDPDGNKIVRVLLRGWEGTLAHNTTYPLVNSKLQQLGYVSLANLAMRDITGSQRVAAVRPDFQGFGKAEVSYWEIKQGSKNGLAAAQKDISTYIEKARELGINARAGEALGQIAEGVPVAGLENTFINIYSPVDGVILYDAYRIAPDGKQILLEEIVPIVATILLTLLSAVLKTPVPVPVP